MERKRVNASNIRAVGYDARERVLEVEFRSGTLVQYSGISEQIYRGFMNAPSPDSFFRDRIEEDFPAKRLR
ncbi:MAG: KTSC domain-containing protein [Betaproteobacteria bacterium]